VNSKNRLQNLFRGWLPQEPSLATAVSPQISQKASHRRVTVYITLAVCVFTAVFLSLSAAYGLGLGNIAGFVAAAAGIITAIAVNFKFNKPNQNMTLTEEGKKTARTLGLTNLGMLCVFLGTYFVVNPAIESAELTLGVWIVLLFSMFAVNSLLYRRLKKQTMPMEGM
jgi:hypothetical protein